jgi:hypothetical protein
MNNNEAQPTRSPYEKLEAVTGTLEKERKFFEALMAADPVAIVVNRIIHLVTFFQGAEKFIPPYLEGNATRLFPNDSLQVAAILFGLLMDITRSARLAGYLCVKGIPEQALAVLRGAIEQTGVYTHVWHEPRKHLFVPDSDSDDYTRAFRSPDDKKLRAELKAKDVKFRFMHCNAAKQISTMYSLLSSYFVHGSRQRVGGERQETLSCEFVDRDSPMNMAQQFEIVQSVMALVYFEILGSIPKDDLLEDELIPLSVVSGLLLPVIAFKQNDEMRELSEKMLEALRQVQFERPKQ